MKRIFCTILIIVITNCLSAQSIIDVYGGFNFGAFKNKSFNEFADSYNAYVGSTNSLVSEFKPLRTASGFNIGIAGYVYAVDGLAVGISYNFMKLHAKSTAELTYGKRHIEQLVSCPFNFGFPIKYGMIVFHPKLGVTNSDFAVYMEYADGTISYGGEKQLNGQYSSFGFIGDISLEVDLAPEDSPIALNVGFSVTMGGGFSESTEWNWARSFTSDYYPMGLPLDYESWQTTADSGDYTAYTNGYADGRFVSYNFFINAKFRIGSHD